MKKPALITALRNVFSHKKREEAPSEIWESHGYDHWPLGDQPIRLPRPQPIREPGTAVSDDPREQGDTLIQNTDLYKPLAPNHIRILRLDGIVHIDEPDLEFSGDILVGGLEEVSLEVVKRGGAKYTGLSYCWESQRYYSIDRDCYIWCDDWIVPVLSNLHSALYQFAEQENGPRAIWADALCIDQKNTKEKSIQVSMMGEIYRSMGSVIVWLGYEGAEVKELFAWLSFNGAPEKKNYRRGEFHGEDIQRGLTYLRYCGWFQRAWTFQEICLAKKATVQTGSEQIDWNTFVSGWNKAIPPRSTAVTSSRFPYDDYRNLSRELHFIEKTKRDKQDLLFLLRSIWLRQATDTRDKAFAILGLYQGAPLMPDYELSIREALVRVSRAAVEETANLDILHYTSQCSPSWMPSFSSTLIAAQFPMKDFSSLTKLEFPELHPRFTFDVQWNGMSLIAAGFVIGRLMSVVGRSEEQLDMKAKIVPFPKCVFTRSDGMELQWPSSPSLRAALLSRPQYNDPVKADIADFISKAKMHDESKCSCETRAFKPESSFPLQYPLEYQNTRPFDWVVVPFGARSPVILRPDHRKPMPYFNRSHPDYSDDGTQYWETSEGSLGTFVMTATEDSDDGGVPKDMLNTYQELTQGLEGLVGLSCIYGDFEIR